MDHHQSDLAGSAAPIARSWQRRHRGSSLAVIAIWTADEIAEGHNSSDEEPVARTVLLDGDRGGLLRSNEEPAVGRFLDVYGRDYGTGIVDDIWRP